MSAISAAASIHSAPTGTPAPGSSPIGTADLLALRDLLTSLDEWLRRASMAPPRAQPTRRIERFGDVEVDVLARAVTRNGYLVPLTPTEFGLLLALLHRRGAVATRDELLREVWEDASDRPTRRVDMKICRLRQKLEVNPGLPRHIVTVPEIGYRLRA
jgi:two-component system KDP operon response regulator KdpE